MRVKQVIKQGNAINLYYLNFFGIVMLRPLLVVLGGGAWDDSSPWPPLAPPVHLFTRLFLKAVSFEAVLLPV
jgi:hypothetical protein